MSLLRVAIVGSGPSGFYAAEALLQKKGSAVAVDMFERLPTPYGLVRGGVAPDHQKIKSVTAVYEKTALSPSFRFLGNVKLGRDLAADELRALYGMVIYAVGNESDRKLGIPGEDLLGNHSATSFVFWYNAHPDYREEKFDFSCESAAVVGIGNVAMDVTRILAQTPQRLEKTDIADYALDALKKSRIKTIWLLGRRGPAQAAYSPAEIQEIGELPDCDLVVDPAEAVIGPESAQDYADPVNKKNADYVQAIARLGEGTKGRKVRLRFCVSPVEAIGEGGRLTALKIEKNRLVADGKGGVKAQGTGRFETIPVGLVFRSVGYRGIPIPGVPFDDTLGRVPNENGRVLGEDGKVRPGEYVVGWAKRGPSGLIGTNRADSVLTVQALLEDAAAGRTLAGAHSREDVLELLKKRGVRVVSFDDWKRLDALELERGSKSGRVRAKFTSVAEMLAALDATAARP